VTEPLELSFPVAATPAHAFDVWASRTGLWWPRDHTVSRDPRAQVTLEPRAGGRIFERASDGSEHDWGEVVAWEPPHRLVLLWHLMFQRDEATEVEITFEPAGDGTTVRIRQTGWEKLGEVGPARRERTGKAWRTVMERFAAAV
jgi:uncharacterized protein YndB with AHSA1/START domain